jgi:glycogen operon protein
MSVLTHELDTNHNTADTMLAQHEQPWAAEKFRGDFSGQMGIDLQPDGCNFAVHVGGNVSGVDLVVHNRANPDVETERYQLEVTDYEVGGETAAAAAGFIPRLEPGDIYSLTAHYYGADDSEHSNSRLLDPYAKSILHYGEDETNRPQLFSRVVADQSSNRPPRPEIKQGKRVIYEAHQKGLTKLNPEIPEGVRGTYAALAHPSTIERLKELGITTVQLLPIQQNAPEEFLYRQGKTNYWGYSTIGFFAPHDKYATDPTSGKTVTEVKGMVDALHEAGIEVVLDVVYNHTAEGGHNGPVYSFKGLDNNGYYHTNEDGSYRDNTGCGNMMNMSNPAARKLVMDSLRYWVDEIGVDGFRFDLAAALLRNSSGEVDSANSPFLREISEDPILKGRLMIAEPWDIGSYPVGEFTGMLEWSGQARDINRGFHNGEETRPSDLATIIAGSFSDKTAINFVTAHDGFTLRDLVTYSHKHNLDNGEDNRDGTNDNRSNNHGIEGPTDNPYVEQQRLRTAMGLALANLLSAGTPMITAGDEFLRTQGGNNNAYSHDNETNWIDLSGLSPDQRKMYNFMIEAISIRQSSVLGHDSIHMGGIPDSPIGEVGLGWLNQNGTDMTIGDWHGNSRVFGVYSSGLSGDSLADSILYYMNGSSTDQLITLPPPDKLAYSGDYLVVAETANGNAERSGLGLAPNTFTLPAKSSIVLRRVSSRIPHQAPGETPGLLSENTPSRYIHLGSRVMKVVGLEEKIAPTLPSDFMTAQGATLPHAA